MNTKTPIASVTLLLFLMAASACHTLGDEDIGPVPEETAGIKVPDDFLFPTSFELTFEVDVGHRIPGRSYAQLCSSFEETSAGRYKIDYGSCVVRGPVIDGYLKQDVLIANHIEGVIVELLQFDENVVPEHYVFATADLRTSDVALSIR